MAPSSRRLRELFTYSGEIAAPWPTAVTRFERVPGQADLVETVTSSYVRDALGRPVETRSSDGTLTSFVYDRSVGLLSTTTGAGETTRYRYDGHGRMVEVIRPPGRGSTRYAYDLDGRLLSQVESTGSDPWVTSHTYDSAGRVTRTDHPDGTFETFTYNPDSTVDTWTTRDGVTVTTAYDPSNRPLSSVPTAASLPPSMVPLDEGDHFAYDPLRMLAAGQDAALTGPATVSWSGHDLAGRPHTETVAGSTLTTTWDTWDHPVGLSLPSGSAYTRAFDTLDQLASVTGTAGLPGASWTWGGGRLYGVETAGGVTTHLTYSGQPDVIAPPGASDSPWRLAGLSWGAGGATWGTLGYAYRGTADLPGDGAKLGRSATGDLAASLGWSWQLDAASRLIGASSGVGSDFRQGYGEADQLVTLARDDTGDAADLETGPSGRITERDGVTFGYDASGRRTSDDRASYRWDWRGRLAEVTISPDAGSPFAGHQVEYLYDGVGRLRARVHLGPDDGSGSRPFIEYRTFLWEGNALLEEAGWGSNDGTWDDPANDLFPRWRRTYVPGPGLDDAPAVRVEIFEPADTPYPDATYAFLRDELGTVVGVAEDGSSTDPGLLVRYLYTPYGEAHAEAGPELRRLLFDNDRTTVDTYEQIIADPATHAAGALLLGLGLPADPGTIAAGIVLTDDTAGTVLAQGTDYVAVPIPDQPETVALLPLEGWVRGHSYRVTLTADLADGAGRSLTQARELALVIPAEGAVTAAAPPDLAVTYDSVTAASSDLGDRFPGGQTMLFQGLWTDPTTGLAYARNRWYDPHNASWMSEDPALDVDSTNLYAFVGWGPQSGTDPLGRESLGQLAHGYAERAWAPGAKWWQKGLAIVAETAYATAEMASVGAIGRIDKSQEAMERGEIDAWEYTAQVSGTIGRSAAVLAAGGVAGQGAARLAQAAGVGVKGAATIAGAVGGVASKGAEDVVDVELLKTRKHYSPWKEYGSAAAIGGAFGYAEGAKFESQQPRVYRDAKGRLRDSDTHRFVTDPEAVSNTSELRRPSLRVQTKRQIEAAATTTPGGKFIDPNTGEVIEGTHHYGHRYGYENRRLIREAQSKGMSQSEFNEWVNAHPVWFQIEAPEPNLSHQYEKPGVD